MIRTPITYSAESSALVAEYIDRREDAYSGSYWNEPAVDPVRAEIKRHYQQEQQYRCCYCQVEIRTANNRLWDAEHILPRVTYPEFLFEPCNLAVACVDCNLAKGDTSVLQGRRTKRYPSSSNRYRILHPHFDEFSDHIAVLLDRIYIPKTRKGEETIRVCRLLRYAYETVGWDSGLADADALSSRFEELMNEDDPRQQTLRLAEVLMVAQVKVSRTLQAH